VSLILTNPPMGRRVARDGSLRGLLERFIERASLVLNPGGRLVWLSPLGARTERLLQRSGFAVTRVTTVDMGGFSAELELAQKR
jgi:tRNA G10  N-methylase Trm11